MEVGLLFLFLIVFITLSIPIGIAIGLSTVLTLLLASNIPLTMVTQNAFAGLDSFTLMAVPFFILAGNLMRYGGVSRRLLEFTDSLVGTLTGGLGMVTTLACMFFAAISGSGPATVSSIGSFMIPAMREKNYDAGYGAAITAAAGTIGVIIPPSIPFVIYGVATGASIGDLFLAGIIPGILIGIGFMFANLFISKKYGYVGNTERPSIIKTFVSAIPSLLVPVIILGGIYGGIFTPTESAVVGVIYSLIVGIFINKELDWEEIKKALKDTVAITGATSFMIGLSAAFAAFITMKQVPASLASILLSISSSKVVILLLINLLLLVIGMFIDNVASCIILAPILLPIVTRLGMSPVQFGVVMTVNLAIGFVTPPYGANLFVASAIGEVPIEKITKFMMPFIIVMIVVLLMITFIEPISMLIPNLSRG